MIVLYPLGTSTNWFTSDLFDNIYPVFTSLLTPYKYNNESE